MKQDYIIHFGVKGMRWGVRKQREPSINQQRRALQKSYRKDGKGTPVKKTSNSAARSYFKADKTGNFATYRKHTKKQALKEAKLTGDQVSSGRYRVARARNIKRKVASATLGAAATVALAATGMAAVGAVLGAGVAVGTNLASGGRYYAKQSKAYGKNRAKTQAKYQNKKSS